MIKNRNLLYTILSFLVIVLHNDYTNIYLLNKIDINESVQILNNVLCYGLTRIAIPCFLFFSGLFFWNKVNSINDVFKKIKKRIKTILVPYLVWNTISILWSYVITIVPFLNRNTQIRKPIEMTIGNVLNGIFLYKYNPHNWYLAQLLVFIVISPLIYYLIKNRRVSLLFLIIIYVLYVYKINLPIYIQEHCGVYYFTGSIVGINFYDKFIKISNNKKHSRLLNRIIYLTTCIGLQLYSFFQNLDFTNSAFIWLIAGLLFWLFINSFENRINPKYLEYSFFVYMSHFIIAPCVNKLIWILLPHNNFTLIFTLLGGATITFAITLFTGYFIKKYIKPLWSILTGE